jgi:hypothetical protein
MELLCFENCLDFGTSTVSRRRTATDDWGIKKDDPKRLSGDGETASLERSIHSI